MLQKSELLDLYKHFESGDLLKHTIPAKEIATVKDRYADYSLISLGEVNVEGKQCIAMRGGEDKILLVDPVNLKIARTLLLPNNVVKFNVRWII